MPLLTSLRKAYPDAAIDWLVHESFTDAIRHHPDLRHAIPFPRSALGKNWLLRRSGRQTFRGLVASLKSPGYDLVIDAQGLGRSGFFAFLTGAKRRIGFAHARELGWLGVNQRISIDPGITHSVDRMLALLEGAGIEPVCDMRLYTSQEDRSSAAALVRTERYAVIAPTSRWAGKRWPEDRFGAVIDALLAHTDTERVAIVASASETDQCNSLISRARTDDRLVDLVGKTSVGELMALIQRAALVVANDSAPLHMAVGFDRPLVALFGPTHIERVGPYQREDDVLQAAAPPENATHKDERAGRATMEAIVTGDVIQACLERVRTEHTSPR